MPRLSAHLDYLFTELPFKERFAAAARVGFKGVEFAKPYTQPKGELGDWLSMNGLTLTVMDAPGEAAVRGAEEAFKEGLQTALEWADFLDCKCLTIRPGAIADEKDYAKAFDVLVANLRLAAREARDWGVRVLIEPVNPFDEPGAFLTRPDDALTLLDEVDAPNLAILFDVYHAQRMQGGLSDFLESTLDHIAHVRIAGVPLRDEPDDGEINNRYILNLLDSHGYPGWIGCAYHPRVGTEVGLKWARDWGVGG